MPHSDRIALSFLAVKSEDFTYKVYRKKLADNEASVPGTRALPVDCLAASSNAEYSRYAVSLQPADGYDEVTVRAWINPKLTTHVLHQALAARTRQADLQNKTELPEKSFINEVGFVLKQHEDAREIMSLRAYDIQVIGRFGFLCKFSLRVPPESKILQRKILELSLTHKNGRLNEDFYIDQYQRIEEFIRLYWNTVSKIKLHDQTEIELENKLSIVPAFTLEKRTFVFGGKKEHKNQFFGLQKFAPYQVPQHKTKIVFIFSEADRPKSQDLFRALRGDTYTTFSGMESMFHVPIGKDNVTGIAVSSFDNAELQKVCTTLKSQFPGETLLPVALVPLSKHSSPEQTQAYFAAKHAFLTHNMASQFVDRKRLEDRNALKWSISNIALALFAKMGGVPWRVKPSTEKCLVVGIGQAHRIVEGKVQKYIAYSVLSDSSGIYETIKILGNTTDKAEYIKNLKDNLRQVLLAHKEQYDSFVLHVSFSMRHEEIDTIRSLLTELKGGEASNHEFVAIKFNDHNDFFGFSTEHNSRVPYEGTVTPISKRDYLLWFSGVGLDDSKVPKKPERPVHLRVLYPESPLNEADLKRVLQDAVNIAGANWRGFNAKSMPISVYYAKLIADYYGHFREANLPEVDIDNLPPWFL